MRLCVLPPIIPVCLLFLPSLSFFWLGKFVHVPDRDTLTLFKGKNEVEVGPYDIDTPERDQPYGVKAKRYTKKIAARSEWRLFPRTEITMAGSWPLSISGVGSDKKSEIFASELRR